MTIYLCLLLSYFSLSFSFTPSQCYFFLFLSRLASIRWAIRDITIVLSSFRKIYTNPCYYYSLHTPKNGQHIDNIHNFICETFIYQGEQHIYKTHNSITLCENLRNTRNVLTYSQHLTVWHRTCASHRTEPSLAPFLN